MNRPGRPGRPSGSKTIPYKILVTLLYGKHKWIERTGFQIRVPVARMSSAMGTRAGKLLEYLYQLEDWGLVESLRWNPNWCTVQLKVPISMVRGQPNELEISDV